MTELNGIVLSRLQIMVKITSTKHIITCIVFFLHICRKHPDLAFPDLIAVPIGRQVQFKDYEFFAIVHWNSGNAVTAVQIKKLTE